MRKLLLIILVEILSGSLSFSQISKSIDSATVLTILKIDSILATKFIGLYEYKYSTSLYSRIDTLKYDYAFIEATRCDSSVSFDLNEWYFIKGHSLPIYLFRKGEKKDIKNEYSYPTFWYRKDITFKYTLKTFRTRFKRLKISKQYPTQEYKYGTILV